MTGQEVIQRLSAYSNVEAEHGIARISYLLEKLGNPQEKLKFVQVGGCNGKGSVSAMLYSIINRCEYRAGLFTYPHLSSLHERIQVDGEVIADDELGIHGEKVLMVAEEMVDSSVGRPSELEMSFAIGLLYFHQRRTDLAVVQVVEGGLYDLTTAIGTPLITVLTNMIWDETETSLDHAKELLGILKSGTKAVLYKQESGLMDLVANLCEEKEIPLRISKPHKIKRIAQTPDGQKFSYDGKIHKFNLTGEHQLRNVAVALEAIWLLQENGFACSQKSVFAGLTRTVLPGRFERVHISPDFILDGCDNPQSVEAVAKTLVELYPNQKIYFIGGVLESQDYEAMADCILPLGHRFIVVEPNVPYALKGDILVDYMQKNTANPVILVSEVEVAVETVLELASAEDVICSWGGLRIVGEIRHILGIC